MRSSATRVVLGITAACLALAGCSDDSGPGPDANGEPIISESVFNVSQEDGIHLNGIEDSTYTFTFALAGPTPDLAEGDIIVGTEPRGYLRRVKTIGQSAGTMTVETDWAALTDAVISGAVDTTLHIDIGEILRRSPQGGAGLAPGAAVAGNVIDLTGIVLFSGEVDGVDVTAAIPHGAICFNPELDLRLSVEGGQVTDFKAVAAGNLSFDCEAKLSASGAVECQAEILLATFSYSAVQQIGDFPVVELITLSFVGGFELDAAGAGASQFGCRSDIAVTAGARHRGEGWTAAWISTSDLDGTPVEWSASTGIDARVYVKPRLEVEFYSVGGPLIEVEPYVEVAGEVGGSVPCAWDLRAGASAALDFDTAILGRGPDDYSRALEEREQPLGSAGGSCACKWTKYEGNPVLAVGPPSAHDDKQAHVSCVLKVGSEYWMYYYGSPTWSTNSKYIMLATSPDGLEWTKYGNGNQPLDFGDAPKAPGYVEIMGVSVLYDAYTEPHFKAWFGKAEDDEYCPIDIFYATSDDGVTWDKRPEPVLAHEGSGWESYRVQWPCVMKVGGTYHMWYEGHPEAAEGGVGHATSPDGVTWTRDPANPVIEPERNAPWVVLKDGVYYMYISAWAGFLCATSTDGAVWDTSGFDTFVIERGPYGGWEGVGMERLAALADDGILKCWYSAGNVNAWQTGFARCGLTPLGGATIHRPLGPDRRS